jgi:hypothetical protein
MIKLVYLLLISYVYNIEFGLLVEPGKNRCVGEYLTENTFALFNIVGENETFRVKLFDPNGNTVYDRENSRNVKIGYTASEPGNHQICIDNNGNDNERLSFEFLSGVAARDYSEVAKKSNLKPIELNLQKLEDMVNYLIKELSALMAHEESSLAINDTLSNKIILFSMITLIAMVAVGLIETLYIRRFLQKRKLI